MANVLVIGATGQIGKQAVVKPTFRIKFRNKSLGIMCQVHQ